jgi:hypothetical protein
LAPTGFTAPVQHGQCQRSSFFLEIIHREVGLFDDHSLHAVDFEGEEIRIPFYPTNGLVVSIEDVRSPVRTPSQIMGDGVFQVLLDLGKCLDDWRTGSGRGLWIIIPAVPIKIASQRRRRADLQTSRQPSE